MKDIKRICINCGSNSGLLPEYTEAAGEMGSYLARRGIEIVYGGARVGLMGTVADSALRNGGHVIGVLPQDLADRVGHTGLSETYVVGSMHERKQLMFDLSDGFVALPGGIGTLEELFEILTWSQLGQHTKPCGLLNVAGFWNKLLCFLDHCVEHRFLKKAHRDMLLVAESPSVLLGKFGRYENPGVEKWFSPTDTPPLP